MSVHATRGGKVRDRPGRGTRRQKVQFQPGLTRPQKSVIMDFLQASPRAHRFVDPPKRGGLAFGVQRVGDSLGRRSGLARRLAAG
jgi:hypothetical protein